ncbi:MAG: calcium-binding protein [Gemmobacter sp.]
MPTLLLPAIQFVIGRLGNVASIQRAQIAFVLPEGQATIAHRIGGRGGDDKVEVIQPIGTAFASPLLEARIGRVTLGPGDRAGFGIAIGDIDGDGVDNSIPHLLLEAQREGGGRIVGIVPLPDPVTGAPTVLPTFTPAMATNFVQSILPNATPFPFGPFAANTPIPLATFNGRVVQGDLVNPAPGPGRVIFVGKRNDTVSGGEGNDTIRAGDGNDRIDTGAGNNLVEGGRGNDTIEGGPGDDTLRGNGGNDWIDGGGGNNVLVGGGGNDTLIGQGNSTLQGGTGNDVLIANGPGRVVMVGGPGADTFVFAPVIAGGVRVVVGDLDGAGGDRVVISGTIPGLIVTGQEVVDQFGSATANGARLNFGNGNVMTFNGVLLDELAPLITVELTGAFG